MTYQDRLQNYSCQLCTLDETGKFDKEVSQFIPKQYERQKYEVCQKTSQSDQQKRMNKIRQL